MPPLQLKQEFASLKAFKEALYVWAIEEHFEPRILKSDSHHVRVGCKFDSKCEFSIRCNAYNASPRVPQPHAKITVLRHEHTCTRDDPTNPLNRQVANRIPWLLENVPRFLDVTPSTSIESIQEAILAQSGYTVNLQQIRRVRRLLVKGKDFRSPQRDHGVGIVVGQQNHPHQHPHLQHPQHTSQSVNGGHPHPPPPPPPPPPSILNGNGNGNGNFGGGGGPPPSRQEDAHDHQHPHHNSPILQNPSNPNHPEDFSSARLATQFEDHSQLMGALTDQGQSQIPVQSNNMFEVNNPPPPRITETAVMSNGPPIRHNPLELAVRCPFCVNVRWMKSIKDAVEHMTMHVV